MFKTKYILWCVWFLLLPADSLGNKTNDSTNTPLNRAEHFHCNNRSTVTWIAALNLVLLVLRYLHGSLCLFGKNGDEICPKISFSHCVCLRYSQMSQNKWLWPALKPCSDWVKCKQTKTNTNFWRITDLNDVSTFWVFIKLFFFYLTDRRGRWGGRTSPVTHKW